MRELRNLNHMSITADDLTGSETVYREIHLKDFDVCPVKSGKYYIVYLDLEGIVVSNNSKYKFFFNIDLFTDNKNDFMADSLEDLSEVYGLLQTSFFDSSTPLYQFIQNQINSFAMFSNKSINIQLN